MVFRPRPSGSSSSLKRVDLYGSPCSYKRTRLFTTLPEKPAELGSETVDKRGGIQCVQPEGVQCDETEADTEQPIAAPAWPFCATRPPLRNRCVLRTARAAGSGFRGRHRALCAGRGILGRLFGLREAARPRTWRYVIAHRMRDKVHVTNSWQSSRICPVLMLLFLCMGWNFDAVRHISRKIGREHLHMMHKF